MYKIIQNKKYKTILPSAEVKYNIVKYLPTDIKALYHINKHSYY